MSSSSLRFRGLVIPEFGAPAEFRELSGADLPDGDVTVRIAYSSLNYKDGLAVTSRGRVLRAFPMVPGIDLAGTVVESASPVFQPGDQVLATGYGIGESTWGGYAQCARVKSEWLVRVPKTLGIRRSMAVGTAGFTAMLAVMALERQGVTPDSGDVLVTGAAGGVGSMAIAILAKLGYRVVASTRRTEERDYLSKLGAAEIVDRAQLSEPTKPIEKASWAGAIDSVGGSTLAHVLAKTHQWGAVASCGLAGGAELQTTVIPFILRGVGLLGINSVEAPTVIRRKAWDRLKQDLPLDLLDSMTNDANLSDVPRLAEEILQGKVRGRTVVDVNA